MTDMAITWHEVQLTAQDWDKWKSKPYVPTGRRAPNLSPQNKTHSYDQSV